MKLSFVSTLLLAAGFAAWGQQAMPRMVSVDPLNGKAGDVITVTGENLQKDTVAKVYLTDDKNDVVCTVTEQTGTTIKFTIPAKANRAHGSDGAHHWQGRQADRAARQSPDRSVNRPFQAVTPGFCPPCGADHPYQSRDR